MHTLLSAASSCCIVTVSEGLNGAVHSTFSCATCCEVLSFESMCVRVVCYTAPVVVDVQRNHIDLVPL